MPPRKKRLVKKMLQIEATVSCNNGDKFIFDSLKSKDGSQFVSHSL